MLRGSVRNRPSAPRRTIAWLAAIAFGSAAANEQSPTAAGFKFYIRKFKIEGAHQLTPLEAGQAVYPHAGPGRTPDDVEQARAALEKTFHDKGYQTVSVHIPEQDPRRGIIRLKVEQGTVARLRVNNARWFLPSRIKRELPSLAEGTVPNFKQVEKEIIAVNRMADRRVTPELRPGSLPGTVDIHLNVEDKLPLHGSLELNNRYSADTTPLRLNGALSYGNLFQLGHTLGLNFQIAPENTDDALVYSAYYLAPIAEKTSLMVNATRQDSDISTLGGAAVAGKGELAGIRLMFDLPTGTSLFHNASLGIDYKNFEEDVLIGKDVISAPIEYYPISANYSGSWIQDKHFTEWNTSLNLHLRGMGSDEADYAAKRYNSSGNFFYLRADAAHTRDLSHGLQAFAKIQAQISPQPLVNSEQIAGGGLGTVRGYLEAAALGDSGLFGSAELRSPTLIGKGDTDPTPENEWRFHAFADAGILSIHDALPGQKNRTGLSSIGIGSRLRVRGHFNASADLALPLIEQPDADDGDPRITFRGWAEF